MFPLISPRVPQTRRGVGSRRLAFALTLATIAATAGPINVPAMAQGTVPIPKPAPKARDAVAQNTQRPTPPLAIGPPAAAPTARTTTPPEPVLPGARRTATIPPGGFDEKQRALAGKVSAYLSSLGTLSGNFIQVGPDGGRTTGDFYIQKPGKVRFEYNPPTPVELVADGSSVIVRDRKLATQDLYPLSQTPLRFLLSDRIDLLRDTNLVGVSADDMFVTVTIEEKQALVGTSRLMMMIGAKDFQLKQWTVTDPQGYDTTVAVYNLDFSKKIDPALFKIDYTNYNR
jgi:outer membrane lipoprotein-sorting protein